MPLRFNTSALSFSTHRHFIYRSVWLLLTLSLLAGTLAAQTDQDAKRVAAERLFKEGVQLFQEGTKESLELAIKKFVEALPLIRAVGDRSGEAVTLFNISYLERNSGNLSGARTRIEEALAIIESLRTKITNQELRSSYFATVQGYYEFYIDLLMRLHKQRPNEGHDGEALQASESARARSLLETLAEANADIRQGVDSKLVERERALQQRLNAKAQEQMKLLSGPHTEKQAKALAQEFI